MTKSPMLWVATSLALARERLHDAMKVASSRCFAHARRLDARKTAAFTLAALVMVGAAEPAFAQAAGGQTDVTTIIQNVVNLITGKPGKLVGIAAIALLGVAAWFGALSLRAAGGVVFGLMLVFGAAWLADQIIGQ